MPINPTPTNDNEKEVAKPNRIKVIPFLLSDPLFTFSDLVLQKTTITEIKDTCSLIKHQKKIFDEWNLGTVLKKHKCTSINLYGESGTGKTVAAHCIASYLQKKIVLVNYADIESKYVGDTSKNLVNLFKFANENDAMLLFDEADALLSKRVTSMSSASDVSVNQTRNVLLQLLDGYDGVIVFTTNFISNYDSAFYRRILSHIRFELPDKEMRKKIWIHYLVKGFPISEDPNELADKLSDIEGVSGSDISNAILKAAVHLAESGGDSVGMSELSHELGKILELKKYSGDSFDISTRKVSEEYVCEKLGLRKEQE